MSKVLNLLGLANRAGKLITGEEFVVEGIRKKQVKLIFLASDAGINTTKKITDKANYYQVEIINNYQSKELSLAIGKNNRMVIGVTDLGFATKFKEIR